MPRRPTRTWEWRSAALQARRYRPSRARRLAWAVLVLTAAGAVAAGVALPWPPATAPGDPAVAKGVAAVQRDQTGLARQLGRLQAELNDHAPGGKRSAGQLAAALKGPARTVSEQGDSLEVTFAEGLFTGDSELTTSAAGWRGPPYPARSW